MMHEKYEYNEEVDPFSTKRGLELTPLERSRGLFKGSLQGDTIEVFFRETHWIVVITAISKSRFRDWHKKF